MGVFRRTRINKNGKKNQYYYIRYWIDGLEHKESIGKIGIVTKTQAQERLNDIKKKIRRGQLDQINVVIPSLKEFTQTYIKYARDINKKRSWKRDELCLRHLNSFLNDKKLSEITVENIDEYKEHRLEFVKPATVNRELEVLRHLFNMAEKRNKFFSKNPVSKAGLIKVNNKQERILTFEEEQRLLSNCNYYMRNIIICALNTVLRKGEIISLKWNNVDINNRIITIDSINSKSKKSRKIPINSVMRKMFLELKLQRQGNEFVFLSSDRKPYARQDSLNRAFYKALEKANIKGLRFHDLRHTCATRMIESGANIVAVKEILCHSSLDMTMRYAHPGDSMKDALEQLTKNVNEGFH